MPKTIGAPEIKAMKSRQKIVALTAYDASFARLVEKAGVHLVLVGDSLGTVIHGRPTTLHVTLEDVIYHTKCVANGLQHTHLVADMPFMSYQVSAEEALRNAGRLVQEGGAHAVKLEGGVRSAGAIEKIVQAGIPVMGHIGLTPQSYHQFGGYRIQGREQAAQGALLQDARAVEEAGAYSLVLEGIPARLAREITASIGIPTIGIGASRFCDGQILVLYDLLGLDERFNPKFLKKYEDFATRVFQAVQAYAEEVSAGTYPGDGHAF